MARTTQTAFEVIAGPLCPRCKGHGSLEYVKQIGDNQYETGLEMGCTSCGGSGGEADIVQGTGKHFWWLWRECPTNREEHLGHTGVPGYDDPCNGTGYVLIAGEGERLLGLLKVAWTLEFAVRLWQFKDGSYEVSLSGFEKAHHYSYKESVEEALAAAIVQALEGER